MVRRSEKKKTSRGDVSKPCSPEFFNVFLPSHDQHKLQIPPDYIKHFSKTVADRIILKDLNGRVWYLGVERIPDGVFIKDGWQRFVGYHGLKVGEFLVFKYNGSFSFTVKVFGINGCKRDIRATQETTECIKTEEEI